MTPEPAPAGIDITRLLEHLATTTRPSVLTARQVADELEEKKSTIETLFRRGDLPGFKIGRAWRITREALDAWIATRQGPVIDPNRIPPRSARGTANLARRRTTPRKDS